MYSLNRATLIGNITRDPELRTTPNGQTVTSFSLATNRRWKNQATNELQESTEYHDCVAWSKAAEFIANYVKKGQKLYIEGRLQTRGWETPDGVKQRRTEVIVENFVPLTPKGAASETGFDSIADLPGVAGQAGDQSGEQSSPADGPQLPAGSSSRSTKKAGAGGVKSTAPALPADDEINLEDIPF